MKTYEIKCEPVTPGNYTQAVWQKEILNEKLEVIQERKLIKESEFIPTAPPTIKYNIYYYDFKGDPDGSEFYCCADMIPQTEIRHGYVEKEK